MRLILLLAAPLLAVACVGGHVEEPAYTLRLSDGDFQLREYAPTIVAETTVQGDALETRFEGFGPLADYIFAKGREGETIAMTAPVTQVREKIAMTAPVTQQEAVGGAWTIAFTMPAGYSMATLPKPASPDVKLVEVPARTMAVFSFSGVATDRDMAAAQRNLMNRVSAAALKTKGDAVFAFYDPPWTPSFFRRNEVMIEVEPRS